MSASESWRSDRFQVSCCSTAKLSFSEVERCVFFFFLFFFYLTRDRSEGFLFSVTHWWWRWSPETSPWGTEGSPGLWSTASTLRPPSLCRGRSGRQSAGLHLHQEGKKGVVSMVITFEFIYLRTRRRLSSTHLSQMSFWCRSLPPEILAHGIFPAAAALWEIRPRI